MLSARQLALDILIRLEEEQGYSQLLLHQSLQKSSLAQRDRSLVTELVYGVIQRQNTLDYLIDQFVKKGGASLQKWVRQLLRLGIYQLTYLDRVPSFAAINETVQLAKQRGHRGIAGLVNGVLRSYLRKGESLLPVKLSTTADKALAYSYPPWMIKRYEQQWGVDQVRQLCQTQLQAALTCLRINSLQCSRDQWLQHWIEDGQGDAVPSPWLDMAVQMRKAGNLANHPDYAQGYYTIQDESSMLVSLALQPQPHDLVIDMCAAPGGKTTHLAELMNNQGKIVANDLHKHKVAMIVAQAKRLGITIIETRVGDARDLQGMSADAVLLDAPCSGFGVIRRKPEIKWRKSLSDIDALVRVQSELLDHAVSLVKPAGTLVYSTCTYERSENQDQVKRFLSRHPEMETDHNWLATLPTAIKERAIVGDGWLQLLPHHLESDGFFIARMKKK